jgi:hypothetical protein
VLHAQAAAVVVNITEIHQVQAVLVVALAVVLVVMLEL